MLPGEAGKTLVLNFYDTGDASQPGTLAVLPPPDSNVTGGVFANCLFTAPPGNATGPPWGTFITTAVRLQDHRESATRERPNYNGQWVTWRDPDPGELHLQRRRPARAAGRKLQFIYPAGTSVSDTTTWSAYILGEPVRLIQ